ncbi:MULTISPECIES: hypothetical protein [Capnocytophaga]|jgi:hypothetical protein|uniref:hypothetical protein n=1 Tax=Capnocytophaga sputigena TaxID=1019 RepID=UPI0028D5DDCA|nr:hypothetical protein [Capnocytophaga sputigena]
MKKFVYTLLALTIGFTSCSKWTETESNAEDFEKAALEDLKNKRDGAKWLAEAERTQENKKALEAYWAQLRDYKQKAWLNTGAAGGQVPMVYFWFDGPTWQPVKGIARGWLQAVPDSVVAISIWGGTNMRPETLTPNHKKDIEVFHKKGSAILMCWQTPGVGLGLPATKDGLSGYKNFRNKYPYTECYNQWGELYARELARYIIAMDFDGYDVDWETCGDHGTVTEEGTPFMVDENDENSNLGKFVKEMAKYFGPVGADHAVKTQAEREANLKALFDASTAGFHAKEKEYIDEFKPYLPANYLTKRYYFCADVPCRVAAIFRDANFPKYFDKHFLQDYAVDGVGTHIQHLGGKYYNSTSANYQAGNFRVMINKGKAVKRGEIWGLGAYHGQSDYAVTNESDAHFKKYLQDNNIKRKYLHYAWTREAIRIANPRPDYSGYKEMEPTIILP